MEDLRKELDARYTYALELARSISASPDGMPIVRVWARRCSKNDRLGEAVVLSTRRVHTRAMGMPSGDCRDRADIEPWCGGGS